MREIISEIQQLQYDHDAMEVWWDDHYELFSPEEYDVLFEHVIQEKFAYLPLVIHLTIDIPESIEQFAHNLKRLSPYIDNDLAWGKFYEALDRRFEDIPEFAQALYSHISTESGEWLRKFIGPTMAHLPEDQLIDEILNHLRSRDPDRVDIGIRGLGSGFRNSSVPQEIADELQKIAEDHRFHEHIIRGNASVFNENPELWKLTVTIGLENPDVIQGIINTVGYRLESEHLPGYLQLLECGLDEDTIQNLQIHNLYLNAPQETTLLADFTVTLSEHDLFAASELAEHTAEKNSELLIALFHRIDNYPSDFHATKVIFAAGKVAPIDLVHLVLHDYDESKRTAMLTLLKQSVGELFFFDIYRQDIAISIADFIDDMDDSAFVRPVRRSIIETEPEYEEEHNKKVFYHLYEVISDCLMDRSFDQNTLSKLDNYPKLLNHFKQVLSQKIEGETFHPMLGLLQNEAHTHLEFLEEHWEQIPPEKRQQLLGHAFESTLSEIGFLLWLTSRGMDYDVDVNLNHFETGGSLEKDVDVVVDGNYIEIQTPQTWRNLRVANRAVGVPNTAYDKIANKFKNDYVGSAELTQEPVFIALDITRSEIDPEQVIASLYGSLKIRLTYDKETGDVVDQKPIRDPQGSLQGWSLLDDNLNGVIWYTARISEDQEGNPVMYIDGDLVPNPHHREENNFDYCIDLKERIFGAKGTSGPNVLSRNMI